jgi:hypothetical protein
MRQDIYASKQAAFQSVVCLNLLDVLDKGRGAIADFSFRRVGLSAERTLPWGRFVVRLPLGHANVKNSHGSTGDAGSVSAVGAIAILLILHHTTSGDKVFQKIPDQWRKSIGLVSKEGGCKACEKRDLKDYKDFNQAGKSLWFSLYFFS